MPFVLITGSLAEILDWLKSVAGYSVVEKTFKILDTSLMQLNNNRIAIIGCYQPPNHFSRSLGSIESEVSNDKADCIVLNDNKVSFVGLCNLSSTNKEDLWNSLFADSNDQEVYVMDISYADAQSLSSCQTFPDTGSLPICRSYRLRKNRVLANPRETLSSIANRTNDDVRCLYFSRHGESEYNVLGRVGGDANLSPRGRLYGESLAKYVNSTLSPTPGFRLWTSCLRRTIQTAKDIDAPQERLSALNELNTGVCDGLTYEEIAERYPIEFAARDDDKFNYRYPGGESYSDLLVRVQPVLERLQVEDNVLVIAHQAVLRCLLAALLNKDEQELPYIHTPLHTVMKLLLKPSNGGCHLELIPLSIECVETHRAKPENCSHTRSAAEALLTVPAHF